MNKKELKVQLALGLLSTAIKIDLAKNKKETSPDVLRILSKDTDWIIRVWVGSNPNTPDDVLQKLSKDNDGDVRAFALTTIRKRKEKIEDERREQRGDYKTRI